MGTPEGLTFVTPTLAYGDGCPRAGHCHLDAMTAVEYLRGGTLMVVVASEADARAVLTNLGLSAALIEDRIRFGQTGEVTVTG